MSLQCHETDCCDTCSIFYDHVTRRVQTGAKQELNHTGLRPQMLAVAGLRNLHPRKASSFLFLFLGETTMSLAVLTERVKQFLSYKYSTMPAQEEYGAGHRAVN